MDLKPIITCDGDKDLYQSLNPELEKKLPVTPVEWRRSYGRPSKAVFIRAYLLPMDENLLGNTLESGVHKQPFFHIFWTDCQDPDDYKNNIKEELADWQKKLKDKNVTDWFIVQVISQESAKGPKSKLQLPRSTVFDKIKSDFCSKSGDRCIQLWEPMRENQYTRAAESWQMLLMRLRQLILLSFNRHLGKLEERVRTLRDQRTDPNWNFTNYFLMHEELAFMFEMMGLHEDALLQYDELDALVTQLTSNAKNGEYVPWLKPFQGECQCWDGVVVSITTHYTKVRRNIQKNKATFLDLRNYIYSRQCSLMLLAKSPWEIAPRGMDFIHSVIQELNCLNISMPAGAAACWVILTCLEILETCRAANAQDLSSHLHTAHLYRCAILKLQDLGKMCGLMPDMTQSEEQKQAMDTLLAGIGKTQEDDDHENNLPPCAQLKDALSSKKAFEALFLDLCDKGMKTYKRVRRVRSAKVIGIQLAKFHICRGDYERAEFLLDDAYRLFKQEHWVMLATETLIKLAECQLQLSLLNKYAASCAVLACEQHLPEDQRRHYTSELLRIIEEIKQQESEQIVIDLEPLLSVEAVEIKLPKGIGSVGDRIEAELKLKSNLTEELTCNNITIHMRCLTFGRGSGPYSSLRKKPASLDTLHTRFQDSPDGSADLSVNLSIDSDLSGSETSLKIEGSRENLTRSDDNLLSSSVATTETEKPEELVRLEHEMGHCLECSEVILKPGQNTFSLFVQIGSEGKYYLKQLCVNVGQLQLLLPQLPSSKSSNFDVIPDPPLVERKPDCQGTQLLTGLPQRVSLQISVGPGVIRSGSHLEVQSPTGLLFIPCSHSEGQVYSLNDPDKPAVMKQCEIACLLSSQAEENERSSTAVAKLPQFGPYERLEFDLLVFVPLEGKMSRSRSSMVHEVIVNCKWLTPNCTSSLKFPFYQPFSLRHVKHSSGTSHFLQILLNCTSHVNLLISSPELVTTNCKNVQMIPLHTPADTHATSPQEVSYLWQMEAEQDAPEVVQCQFTAAFSVDGSDKGTVEREEKLEYTYKFQVENVQTLFTVSSEVSPPEGVNDPTVGDMCTLSITVTNLTAMDDVIKTSSDVMELIYEVDVSNNMWMIADRNMGVLAIPKVAMATCQVMLSAMPIVGGYLPLPGVKLMKYQRQSDGSRAGPGPSLYECRSVEALNSGTDSDNLRSACSESDLSRENAMERVAKVPPVPPPEAPVVVPFSCGQVYNCTQAMQVHVFPSTSDTRL